MAVLKIKISVKKLRKKGVIGFVIILALHGLLFKIPPWLQKLK